MVHMVTWTIVTIDLQVIAPYTPIYMGFIVIPYVDFWMTSELAWKIGVHPSWSSLLWGGRNSFLMERESFSFPIVKTFQQYGNWPLKQAIHRPGWLSSLQDILSSNILK